MIRFLAFFAFLMTAYAQEFIPFLGGPVGNGLLQTNVVYYSFDEASGDALDSNTTFTTILTSDDLTEVGTISRVAGVIGNAATIDSGETFENIADDPVNEPFEFHYDNVNDGNISASSIWVKMGTLTGDQTIMGIWGDAGVSPGSSWRLYFDDAATDRWVLEYLDTLSGTPTTLALTPAAAINTTDWNLLVIVHDDTGPGGNFWLYSRPVGGAWSSATMAFTVLSNGTFKFRVGGHDDGAGNLSATDRLNGATVDELSFWHITVNSCQRNKLYNSGSGLAFGSFDLLPCAQ